MLGRATKNMALSVATIPWDSIISYIFLFLSVTQHYFLLQFLPHCGDAIVASGAGDSRVQVHDLCKGGESVHLFDRHHSGRVKRMDVAEDTPHLLWSVGEDGLVIQVQDRTI